MAIRCSFTSSGRCAATRCDPTNAFNLSSASAVVSALCYGGLQCVKHGQSGGILGWEDQCGVVSGIIVMHGSGNATPVGYRDIMKIAERFCCDALYVAHLAIFRPVP